MEPVNSAEVGAELLRRPGLTQTLEHPGVGNDLHCFGHGGSWHRLWWEACGRTNFGSRSELDWDGGAVGRSNWGSSKPEGSLSGRCTTPAESVSPLSFQDKVALETTGDVHGGGATDGVAAMPMVSEGRVGNPDGV